ncbi:hypothetical protein CHS0354_011886 [Potamilus streckersoni]|uniref:receptor protein-tyrosine kinase n=1 Tax=Potamilus streckersoni TaxID=2493646 RepID=A0AAE0W5S4_9BIVA|nr:hypothetical protein CHS0354_011886 [Potamilus streckersoni]
MMAERLKILLILLGPIFGWIFTRVECVSQTGSQGNYGQPCKNQTCNAPLKCLVDTCWCDVSYNWDSEKKTCRKLCLGTDAGLVRTGTFNEHYDMYKQKYTNCAYVEGNLELTFLEGDYDLQFLQSIEEVTGYVLIVSVWSNYVPLKNLRIIRGRTLYKYLSVEYALYIALNYNPKNSSQGIFELGFKNLTEITKGKVYFHNNNALCYETSIRWQDINPMEPNQSVVFKSDTPYEKRLCGECHDACLNSVTKEKHCWGMGPDMCQKLNYGDVCSLSCEGRCFGSGQNQCCHKECAAGCHGPRKSECYACKTFYNDGMCETNCPAESIYDNGKLTWIKNPNAKYAYGSLCVKVCPEHLLQDQGACVVKCPDNKEPDVNKTACVECSGACKKTCDGTINADFVHQENIHKFKDCTSIHGNLRILKSTFDGDPFRNISGINITDLQVFKNVTEITGYLTVQQTPSNLMDLSFLSKLEIIQGRDLSSGRFSVSLASINITELGLKSLQHIKNGDVIIAQTPHLCYLENISFVDIFSTPKQALYKAQNKNASDCRAEGKVCDPECSHHGCWGSGPLNCIKCANKRVLENDQCVRLCSDLPLLYEDGDTCKKCHAQCADSCTGPGPSKCTRCKQVKFLISDAVSGVCMEKCPVFQKSPMYYYPDERNICRPCSYTCAEGCTGPSNEVRNGGCNTCELAINETLVDGTISCLPQEWEDCPKGYYMTRLGPLPVSPLSRKNICQPCHALCLDCNGPDIGTCTECRFFKHFSLCVSGCPNYTYPETSTKSCHQCDNECVEGCSGSSRKDCRECKNYKIIHNNETVTFECVEKCPPNLPYLVENDDPDKKSLIVCADETHPQVIARMSADQEEERKRIMAIAIPVCGGVIVLGILLALFGYYWRQRERAKENTVKLTARMTGYGEAEPLTPTDAKPDLSILKLIKESDLRRGGIIGSGAFGTVYKGFWIPEGENVKIPVAIKVLQEGSSPNHNKELLEEARVMASVDHPCCIRILAVCMASQMMLITQLMPLGCLLDYIRKHKDNTGSKSLLNWCTQIARGMTYLEERGIVHRDLAARNVLVQSASQVKITDFGLAKLLDYNEEEYHAAGGKMPIKWLALECIQHRIFTHKSDVWSFGVTVWELFTYGARPYETVRARDVPDLLEKGERLPQPPICTIDVYMIMIKCWMLDAESRPSFKELAEEFAKMARDPGRYLVIQGDKLMRLPSYSYDKNDLARHLSVAQDGPEEVIEADDYLQPRSSQHIQNHVADGATPVIKTPLTTIPSIGSVSNLDFKEKEVNPGPRREKRYGHLESAAAARQQRELSPSRARGDSINSRYSSDPVKFLKDRGIDEHDAVFSQNGPNSPFENVGRMPSGRKSRSPPVQSPDVTINLPVDEDDYLQPKSSNHPAYMDIIDRKDYYINEKQLHADDYSQQQYIQPDPICPRNAVENLEYFERTTDDVFVHKPMKPKVAPKPKRLVNDYYNDTGMRQKNPEGQPLLFSNLNSESNV